MSMTPGSRLGPYEITGQLGAGGMGEVYEARDTRLDRKVAVKVLPESFATDPGRLERFEREARAVSKLSHPHICTLHDVGEHEGVHYLVMERLKGETLSDRLKRGALTLDEALVAAAQIADALDAAHRAGVVHRDLKPGNVILTKTGIMLLDFGLAKTEASGEASDDDSEDSQLPTQHKPLTGEGTILGTVQYMAPEQLEGKEVDARADLFALGAVLYEMLTGRKAFTGESQASLISAVMSSTPTAVSELLGSTPVGLERLVGRCLAKDPELRWQTARDLMEELVWIRQSLGTEPSPSATAPARGASSLRGLAIGLGVGAILTTVLLLQTRPRPKPLQVARFTIQIPENEELYGNSVGRHLAVSPDGRQVVYGTQSGGRSHLFVRSLDSLESRALAGSEDAQSPFFYPDGRFVGFLKPDSGAIVRVRLDGDIPSLTICESCARVRTGGALAYGATVTHGSEILYGPTLDGQGLAVVGADGGTGRVLTIPKEGTFHGAPQSLPDGRSVLFSVGDASGQFHPALLELASEEWVVLPSITGTDVFRYVATGHLLWMSSTTLMAAPISLPERRVLGRGVPVVESVFSGYGSKYAVSNGGTLAYLPLSLMNRRLVRVSRDGSARPALQDARDFDHPRLSPDGTRLAVDVRDGVQPSVWVYELARGSATRLTFEEPFFFPCWHADGQSLFVARWDEPRLYSTRGDGIGAFEPFLGPEYFEGARQLPRVTSHHPSGHALMVGYRDDWDIWWVPTGEEPQELVASPFTETAGVISPDGRYLAYNSNESGRFEVYVVELGGSRRFTVSTRGGSEPLWSADGTELYYRRGLQPGVTQLFAVPIRTVSSFEAGEPRLLFEGSYNMSGGGDQHYAVFPDGQSFLMMHSVRGDLHVIVNWLEELAGLTASE